MTLTGILSEFGDNNNSVVLDASSYVYSQYIILYNLIKGWKEDVGILVGIEVASYSKVDVDPCEQVNVAQW